ncbi:MAG: hypothetical protein V3U54_08795 [Thermodesulfobacteriota bacterium]
MIIIDPEKEIALMFWADFKEQPGVWLKFLLWTVPTDIAYGLFLAVYKKVWFMFYKAPWWEIIALAGLTGYLGGLLVW